MKGKERATPTQLIELLAPGYMHASLLLLQKQVSCFLLYSLHSWFSPFLITTKSQVDGMTHPIDLLDKMHNYY